MKVLAFDCSPKMDKGNTALILAPFLEGMREARAEVELFYMKKLKVNPCQGEFNCWLKTPGECFQKDDMQMLHPKLREADIWVFTTPVYVDGGTGPMKNLMDRMLPLLQPLFEIRDGHFALRFTTFAQIHLRRTSQSSNSLGDIADDVMRNGQHP